jgi:hypothetical protein
MIEFFSIFSLYQTKREKIEKNYYTNHIKEVVFNQHNVLAKIKIILDAKIK